MKITVFGDIMQNFGLHMHQTLPAECNNLTIGGTLVNVCTAAKRFFDSVVAIGAVGEKEFDAVVRKFVELRVEQKLLSVPGVSTGVCLLSFEDETRRILSIRQANMNLAFNSIDMLDVLSSEFLFVNGWSFLPESETSKTLIRILIEANERGIPSIFDILLHHIQWEEMTTDYIRALQLCNVVICEASPKNRNDLRIFDTSILHKVAKACRLFIFFDWVNMVWVETSEGKRLTEEQTRYTFCSAPEFLDEVALRQVVKYFSKKK